MGPFSISLKVQVPLDFRLFGSISKGGWDSTNAKSLPPCQMIFVLAVPLVSTLATLGSFCIGLSGENKASPASFSIFQLVVRTHLFLYETRPSSIWNP